MKLFQKLSKKHKMISKNIFFIFLVIGTEFFLHSNGQFIDVNLSPWQNFGIRSMINTVDGLINDNFLLPFAFSDNDSGFGPKLFRVSLEIAGLDKNSIKTEINNKKLIITGKEGEKVETGDFLLQEFRKTFDLPDNLETEKMQTYINRIGRFTVEIPFKSEKLKSSHLLQFDQLPKIVEAEKGNKMVALQLSIPSNIDPSKITLTHKNNYLILKAQDKSESPEGVKSFYYYKKISLPEGTNFDKLQSKFADNYLTVSAPFTEELKAKDEKQIPIEFKP